MELIYKQLSEYVSNNELKLALTKMKNIFTLANSDFLNDAISLLAQLEKLRSDVRKGIIKYSDETFRQNVITNSILDLIEELKNNPKEFEEFENVESRLDKATKKRNLILPISVKDVLYERLSYVKDREIVLNIIWIDDNPGNNYYESWILKKVGFSIDIAKSSREAFQLLKEKQYDLILTDVGRDGKRTEGYEFHLKLIDEKIDIPLIFYTSFVDRSKGVPPYAFGIADLPNELLHLIVDVVQRK